MGLSSSSMRPLVHPGTVMLYVLTLAILLARVVWAAPAAEAPARPDFAVYASERVVLGEGARVRGGAVGVAGTLRPLGDAPEFRLTILGARVDGDVYADSVRLGPGSRVGDVYTNRLSEVRAKRGRVFPLPPELPAVSSVVRNAAGRDELRVASRGRVTLGHDLTRVEVAPHATIVLPGGRFNLETLDLGEGSRIEVERPSVLAVSRQLTIGPRVDVGPADRKVTVNLTILVGGTDGVAPGAVVIGERTQLRALVLSPRGALRVGEKVRVSGALHGQSIDLGPGSDVTYYPGLVPTGTDFQCVFPQCQAVAGGQIECHPAPAVGLACDDGNLCTENDVCNSAGLCAGEPMPDPDPEGKNPCVRDTCDPVAGIYEPKGTVCASNDGCTQTRWCDGQGLCAETQYFPDGTACDDGIPGNGADQCFQGACIAADYCSVNVCGGDPGDPDAPTDLTCWLDTHPQFKEFITWHGQGEGGFIPYDLWTPARKQELKTAFEAAWHWLASGRTNFQGTPVPEPPPNAKQLADLDYPTTEFTEDVARPLYFAHVAQSLALEIRKDVPWSLCDNLPTVEHILGAGTGHYATYTVDGTPNGAIRYRPNAEVTPAHPTVTYSFLVDSGLIGATRVETIGKLLDWSRRLAHFSGDVTTINLEGHWQYRGYPPVSRTIAGTVATPSEHPNFSLFGHWTRGCWGTTGFLKNVLMSVNIPVIKKWVLDPVCPHATPYFPSEDLYMSHGDDPYGFFREGTTTVVPPIGAFLIDEATYTQWFTGPTEYVCSNVSRRDAELGLALLPDWLAQAYCDDIQQNKDHASGAVYHAFHLYYTVQQLEAANLWSRLSQRAADLGLWCGGM